MADAEEWWRKLSLDEQIEVLYRAQARGVQLPSKMISVFEALRDAGTNPSPNALLVTADTPDELVSAFLRGDAAAMSRYQPKFIGTRKKRYFRSLVDQLYARRKVSHARNTNRETKLLHAYRGHCPG